MSTHYNTFTGFYIAINKNIKGILSELLANGIGDKFYHANEKETEIMADFSTPLTFVYNSINIASYPKELALVDIEKEKKVLNQEPLFKEIIDYINSIHGVGTAVLVHGTTSYIY